MKNCNNCDFFNNCGFDFIASATLIALFLARDLTSPEQDLLGNFFFLLGQNLTSIAAFCNDTEQICEVKKDNGLVC